MGLESATYISGLTASWPVVTDRKSQGDDHLRLIKSVLQSTFPNADKPFRFPTAEATAANIVLDSTDYNNVVMVDTSAASRTVTLPAGLVAADKGWNCIVIKTTNDANAAIVSAASGNISTKVGDVASVRVGILNEPCTFFWTGTAWIAMKPGPMIGSTEEFDGASLPPGYLWMAGQTYVQADFRELFAVLGSTTLRDKRGRASFGRDDMNGSAANRLVNVITGSTLGGVGGLERLTISDTYMPGTAVSVSISDPQHKHSLQVTSTNILYTAGGTPSPQFVTSVVASGGSSGADMGFAATGITASGQIQGGANPYPLMNPAIIVNKIIRAC